MTADPTRITVAVCTFRRPAMLERLLRALDTLPLPADTAVDTLVVDNDPAASAATVVAALRLSRAVRYVHEPAAGISAARNAALRAASDSDYLAFIDDDEVPEPEWLVALLATARACGADIVAGPTASDFARPLPRWIDAGGYFARTSHPSGSVLPFAACGNLLLHTDALKLVDRWFDERFGLTGGEDSEFTARLARHGARLVWCQEAVTVETVPADRITARWVLRRSYRMGNTAGRMRLVAGGPATRVTVFVGGIGRVIAGLLRIVLSLVPGRPHWADGVRIALRGGGMVAAATGRTFWEYGR